MPPKATTPLSTLRVFMTGASGFLGGALARRLRLLDHEVVALVRRLDASGDLASLGVRLGAGDITDRDAVRSLMRGADAVFHLAAWYRVGHPDRDAAIRANVEGTRVVLEAMRDLGIPRGVYTSTLAVFGDTRGVLVDESHRHDGPFLTVYDETKWRAHYEVALPLVAQGLPLTIVQPGVVYGVGDHSPMAGVFERYFRRRLPAIPAELAYSWGHVEDTAAAHLLALERGRRGESYIIAGPSHTLIEALRIAESVTGIPAPRLVIPARLVRGAVGAARLLGLDSESMRVMAGTTYIASSAKALRELGFAPRTLREGFGEVLPRALEALSRRP